MQAYKTQLRRRLADHGWEIVEVIEGDQWWADEYWKIQSRRNVWGLEVVLTFLVDPMWEGHRKKGAGVWAVGVTAGMPDDRQVAERGIVLSMTKGLFDEKLTDFVAALDQYRNEQEQATAGEGE